MYRPRLYRPRPAILGLTALAFAVGVTGCSVGPDRDESGAITETGKLDAFSIKVGDCLDDPVGDGEEGEFDSITAVPCDQAHDMEAFSLFDLPSGSFPGDEAVASQAADGCVGDFEDYVGESYTESVYELNWFAPTVESWEQGDQEIVCIIDGTVNGDRLEGSVERLAYVETDNTVDIADATDAADETAPDEASLSGGMSSENAGSAGGMTNRGSDAHVDSDSGGLELDVFALKLGDCLNDPSDDAGLSQFNSVSIVPCVQAHDMEAYSFFDMPAGPFPGDEAITEAATEGCSIAFHNYVGLSYDESIYLVSWFTPTLESWSQGDQEVVCLISGTVEGDRLQGSVEGTEI
jgi:hypothetical protein